MKKLIMAFALCLFATNVFCQKTYEELLAWDWAFYGKYAKANETLKTRPDVVFMGNSITEGWFDQHPDFFTKNNFAGRGIGGQTTSQMLSRFRQDVIDLHPRVVAIMAGTNDIAMNNGYIRLENVFQNIVSMCELARFNDIKVLLCSVTPCAKYGWRPEVEAAKYIPLLNKMLREYAAKTKGVDYVDYFTSMADKDNAMLPGLSPEGCHPNGDGYKVMEPILIRALNKIDGTDKNYFVY